MTSPFLSVGVPGPLAARLVALGLRTPTRIQAAALPGIMAGRDVVVTAETGSGKTLLYALPALARLRAPARRSSLLLAPTHELCRQISRVVRSLDDGAAPVVLGTDAHGIPSGTIAVATPAAAHAVRATANQP